MLEQNPRQDQNQNPEPNQLLDRSRPPGLNQSLEQNQLRERNHWIIRYKQSSVLLAVIFWCIPKELGSKPSDVQNAETSSK
jgi:replication-associated recombination protein RarA